MTKIKDENRFRKKYCKQVSLKVIEEYIRKRNFLVTGSAGSIGSSLVRKLLEMGAKKVYAVDNDETRLERLKVKANNSSRLELVLADVRDTESLTYAIDRADIIYHAAALKHVPLSEYYPLEYVRTNIIGTENIIRLAIEGEAEKLIYISTDKAVKPTNVMGATKLLGEKLTIASNLRKNKTLFSVVRFGNVIYTRGSVIEIFLNQIMKSNYITVTDPSMTRFMMSIDEAVKLILQATYLSSGGEVFVLKMPSVNIGDLAKAFINVIGEFIPTITGEKIKIKIIGRRPGEKIHEELMTRDEVLRSVECKDMYIILSELVLGKTIDFGEKEIYDSNRAPRLSISEIERILKEFLSQVLPGFPNELYD